MTIKDHMDQAKETLGKAKEDLHEKGKAISKGTRDLMNAASRTYGPFYGLYRGQVVNNLDPLELNRLLVDVPTLPCSISSFAYPSAKYGGFQVGMVMTPPIGTNIWVKFENGDPSFPVWVGCFWTEGEKPAMAELPTQQLLSTGSLNAMVNDIPAEAEFLVEYGPPGFEVPVTMTVTTEAAIMTVGEVVFTVTPEETSALMEPTNLVMTNELLTAEAPGFIDVTCPENTTTGNVTIEGAVEVEGNVTQTGAVEIEGDVNQVGAVEIEGNIEVAGAVEVEGNVNSVGAVEIEGNVEILGAMEIAGDIALAGAIEVGGAVASVSYTPAGALNTI